jgi:hypothetical protein
MASLGWKGLTYSYLFIVYCLSHDSFVVQNKGQVCELMLAVLHEHMRVINIHICQCFDNTVTTHHCSKHSIKIQHPRIKSVITLKWRTPCVPPSNVLHLLKEPKNMDFERKVQQVTASHVNVDSTRPDVTLTH